MTSKLYFKQLGGKLIAKSRHNTFIFSAIDDMPRKIFLEVQATQTTTAAVWRVTHAKFAVPAVILIDEWSRVSVERVNLARRWTLEQYPLNIFDYNPYKDASEDEMEEFLQSREEELLWTWYEDGRKEGPDMWDTANCAPNQFFKSPIGIINAPTWARFWKDYTRAVKLVFNETR